jgi:hypothetical protein
MEEKKFKPEYQREKEARELALYNEYNELMKTPGAMATAVNEFLMKKHNLHARTTIYYSRKNVEKRMREGAL